MMKNNDENNNKHNNIFNNQHHYRYYCPSNTDYHYKNEIYYSCYNDKYPHDNEQTNRQTTRHLTLPGRRSMWVNYHTEIVRRQYWLWLVGHLAYYHQFAWNISRPAGNDTWCTMQYYATTTGLLLILVLFRFAAAGRAIPMMSTLLVIFPQPILLSQILSMLSNFLKD